MTDPARTTAASRNTHCPRPLRRSRSTSAPAVLRPRAALTAEVEALVPLAENDSRFHQGARDALRWMVDGGPGPLTGSSTGAVPARRALVAELAAAEAQQYSRPPTDPDYAAGLEHAVMWAVSATPALPSAVPPRRAAGLAE